MPRVLHRCIKPRIGHDSPGPKGRRQTDKALARIKVAIVFKHLIARTRQPWVLAVRPWRLVVFWAKHALAFKWRQRINRVHGRRHPRSEHGGDVFSITSVCVGFPAPCQFNAAWASGCMRLGNRLRFYDRIDPRSVDCGYHAHHHSLPPRRPHLSTCRQAAGDDRLARRFDPRRFDEPLARRRRIEVGFNRAHHRPVGRHCGECLFPEQTPVVAREKHATGVLRHNRCRRSQCNGRLTEERATIFKNRTLLYPGCFSLAPRRPDCFRLANGRQWNGFDGLGLILPEQPNHKDYSLSESAYSLQARSLAVAQAGATLHRVGKCVGVRWHGVAGIVPTARLRGNATFRPRK